MAADSRSRSRTTRIGPLIVVLLAMVLLAAGGIYLGLTGGEPPVDPASLPTFEPPPLTKTRFLNTGSDVTYVGNQACAECHAEQFQSYELTAHSRALSRVDPSVEPDDAEFTHDLSHRKYRIYRKDGEYRQHEFLADDEGTIAQQDYAATWLIGSGRHSRSYLVDIDGFMVESPTTWYSARKSWGLSPGYDNATHWGFERAAGEGCLVCHVGLIEREGDSLSRLTIRQDAISCERCHGPGSLHVARREQEEDVPQEDKDGDPTIVNPSRLSRELGEAICAQCHLRGDATVVVRGRQLSDYRPGLPLTDVRIDYQLKAERRPMKVVGHVEQLRLSRCWQADETLTCITCHDPHRDAPPEDKVAYYRDKCLQCHTPQACGLPTESQRRIQAADNCNQCHMPQVETDIPHIAFTHHRIGVHTEEAAPRVNPREAELVPATSVAHLPEIDRERCLGLAYLEYSEKQSTPEAAREYRSRAWQLLTSIHDQGLFDGDTEAGLARILWEDDPSKAVTAAQFALQAPTLTPQSRINALFILADAAYRSRDFESAIESLEVLIRLRRLSEDHFLLAICQAELGLLDAAIERGEEAVKIHPFRAEFYQFLAEACRMAGRDEDAARYDGIYQRFQKIFDANAADGG